MSTIKKRQMVLVSVAAVVGLSLLVVLQRKTTDKPLAFEPQPQRVPSFFKPKLRK